MAKITIIGAGSVVFTRNLCSDILLTPALQDCTLTLMDIDAKRLAQAKQLVEAIVTQRGLLTTVEATVDQREAVTQADYVITTFQQGGLEAYAIDIEIPQRYGVEQCVGDTLGPGGVFRSLRTIPVLISLCEEMNEVANPDALLLNYVNPMAANCWAIDRATGRPHVGLCHSVQGTSEMLAQWINVPYDEISFRCLGINHQSFFTEFKRHGEDLYPLIWETIERDDVYAQEPVRIEIMKHFGYFVTESSGHASEYMPYFRKTAQMVDEELVPHFKDAVNSWYDYGRSGGYLRHCQQRLTHAQAEFQAMISGENPAPSQRTHEYGSYIIEAMETNQPVKINGNVPNRGLIDNLPDGCCVEVACLVDSNGVQPTAMGKMPPQLAALNQTNINVQSLIVEAALTRSKDAVHHAVMLDPLTAAVCTLPQIRTLVDEMLVAQAAWLPELS
ncbi:MAG: alpha-glucosidase/alpha-galactosidase [Chloroflexota bacterium]